MRKILSVLLSLGLLACSRPPLAGEDSQEIKIGVFQSLTGPEATFGQDALHGIALAAEEINAEGGLLGRKVKLIVEDNQSKPGETSTIVRELITQKGVVALLGEVASSRSLEAAPIAQANGVPMIADSTNPKVTEMGDCIFRICFTDDYQGKVIAEFVKSLGIEDVAILTDLSQAYSVGLAESFSSYFTAQGGRILKRQDYRRGDRDFSAQLTAIQAVHPQMVVLPAYYTEAPLIIKQARQLGLTVPFVGGDGWDSETMFELGGAAVEGNYFVNHFSAENKTPRIQNFVQKFQQKYGTIPPSTAALSYDSMKLLADAIRRAQSTDRAKIRQALTDTKNFPAISGALTFDEHRNPKTSAVIIRLHNNKFAYFKTIVL
ncbi:MAG: ethanolamine utilization protein EutJ [Verrucomicrobia bacterium]|nr:MAG: ethanolamine utilization protein EutJ [Verrucomicrobiota bacterium]